MHTIIETTPYIIPLHETHRYLLEGPQALKVHGRAVLSWVNIQTSTDSKAGEINLYFHDTGERRILPQAGRPGFAIPLPDDRMICGQNKTIGIVDLLKGTWDPLAELPDWSEHTIINDGELSLDGKHLFFGTKDVRFKEKIAHLYHYDVAANRIRVMKDGQTCSNGKFIAVPPEKFALYDIDTPTQSVMRYDLDEAEPWNIRGSTKVLDTSDQLGLPDGMIRTGPDTLVIAFYNPLPAPFGRALHYNFKTGQVIGEYRTPGATRVTCPQLDFVGGCNYLFLTTCTEGGIDAGPNAGAIFRARFE